MENIWDETPKTISRFSRPNAYYPYDPRIRFDDVCPHFFIFLEYLFDAWINIDRSRNDGELGAILIGNVTTCEG